MTLTGFICYAALLVVAPWCLGWLGWSVRCGVIASVMLVALVLWLRAVWPRRGQVDHLRLSQARSVVCLGIAAAGGGWVSLLSYSAQVSICPSLLIYAGLGAMVLVPITVTELICRRCLPAGEWRLRYLVLGCALLGSMLVAQPGRRFHGGETSKVVRCATADVGTVKQAVARVHESITYQSAPFTDTAADTLQRGAARCGGMANALDKVLKALGVESRIVHLEDAGRIHTLVEYYDDEAHKWMLADAQHNLAGGADVSVSGWDAVHDGDRSAIPEVWRGYTHLYVYRPLGGYRRITMKNRDVYYP